MQLVTNPEIIHYKLLGEFGKFSNILDKYQLIGDLKVTKSLEPADLIVPVFNNFKYMYNLKSNSVFNFELSFIDMDELDSVKLVIDPFNLFVAFSKLDITLFEFEEMLKKKHHFIKLKYI